MPRTTSDEHIQCQDHKPKENEMYTSTDTMQAEADYRRERIARDFRRSTRTARPRGRGEPAQHRRWQLHLRHA
jgi:hypothetical protein